MKIETRELNPDLWPAFERLFGARGACGGCWCMAWRVERGGADPAGGTISLSLDRASFSCADLGAPQSVTLTATTSSGTSDSCTAKVTVQDLLPPMMQSFAVSPSVLWPPNHKLVTVAVSAQVTDNCTASPSCKIVGVTANEPITEADWVLAVPPPARNSRGSSARRQ